MRNSEILTVYTSGIAELVIAALGFAVAGLLGLQMCAVLTGSVLNAEAALTSIWQALILMGLWPGQTFWTIRRTTANGFEHSVIGAPSDDDLRLRNHHAARRVTPERQG